MHEEHRPSPKLQGPPMKGLLDSGLKSHSYPYQAQETKDFENMLVKDHYQVMIREIMGAHNISPITYKPRHEVSPTASF